MSFYFLRAKVPSILVPPYFRLSAPPPHSVCSGDGTEVNLESNSIGCSTEPVDRIWTRPMDTNVKLASTSRRWSRGRSALRWLETLKCRRHCKSRGINVASHSNVATSGSSILDISVEKSTRRVARKVFQPSQSIAFGRVLLTRRLLSP